ncbi:tryptophan halogenase family protein [Thalassotalea agarivorans]|uniref:Tryptophan halogenase n=1 Tax=Thalassotalea agarivorans TaxID=349064 RepID=A0A1I0DYK3_THASX|nr:tryptophan halogenase family protein [Thalassotalea agarivorans]SET37810.1 Tryptophan halogenase [Thalassotalea agarivorans]
MQKRINHVVILGGGSAGWLTAGILAAEHQAKIKLGELSISLIESPNIPTVGVGEGTWPTMPQTLKKIGISELTFLSTCHATFKQGSKFINWHHSNKASSYTHPFEVVPGAVEGEQAKFWFNQDRGTSYAQATSLQHSMIEAGLAPKTNRLGEYDAYFNYGYHLDAGKFATLLQQHCTTKLGVQHVLAEVASIKLEESGDISRLVLANNAEVAADLFVDCSGFKGLLIGECLGVGKISADDALFANRAVTVQVPYADANQKIPSCTLSTAQESGWIWDIGLTNRRGVGYVFSDNHSNVDQAHQALEAYLKTDFSSQLVVNDIKFTSGYREKFWHKNCVAIGLSAGFIEPLEASALVLVELSATFLAEHLDQASQNMGAVEAQFNQVFSYRWQRVIEFLKLHYLLSERTEAFWQDNKAAQTIPDRLQHLLNEWQTRPPTTSDFPQAGEVFQAASYQYVLYGSGFIPKMMPKQLPQYEQHIRAQKQNIAHNKQQLLQGLPSNRALITSLIQ